ncbi:unnamed protein product [Trypanosoma congolense IL3000]|uniref:WGS project CAEQ00000000 data, annotated contig 1882 n=1 Tax=Trypanosoma congolense (strain IL3000) TaxID=1068625 RepID=F9W9N5_TRYCI|nr:unnamed protein product [Trypanosoma congolense IL3000]
MWRRRRYSSSSDAASRGVSRQLPPTPHPFRCSGMGFPGKQRGHIGVTGSVGFPIFLSQKVNEANVFPRLACLLGVLFQHIVLSPSRMALCAWNAGYLMCGLVTFSLLLYADMLSFVMGYYGCLRASLTASSKIHFRTLSNNVIAPRRAQSRRVMMPSPTRYRMSLVVFSCKRSDMC